MYKISRKFHYKWGLCVGLFDSIMFGGLLYGSFIYNNSTAIFLGFILLFMCIIYTIYFLIGLILPRNNFVALQIDDDGISLCSKKGKATYVPWEKIRYVTFVYNDYGSKIAIRQSNKESHYLFLADYYFVFKPKGAINAAYKYADDQSKVIVMNDSLTFTYENSMSIFKDFIKEQQRKKSATKKGS